MKKTAFLFFLVFLIGLLEAMPSPFPYHIVYSNIWRYGPSWAQMTCEDAIETASGDFIMLGTNNSNPSETGEDVYILKVNSSGGNPQEFFFNRGFFNNNPTGDKGCRIFQNGNGYLVVANSEVHLYENEELGGSEDPNNYCDIWVLKLDQNFQIIDDVVITHPVGTYEVDEISIDAIMDKFNPNRMVIVGKRYDMEAVNFTGYVVDLDISDFSYYDFLEPLGSFPASFNSVDQNTSNQWLIGGMKYDYTTWSPRARLVKMRSDGYIYYDSLYVDLDYAQINDIVNTSDNKLMVTGSVNQYSPSLMVLKIDPSNGHVLDVFTPPSQPGYYIVGKSILFVNESYLVSNTANYKNLYFFYYFGLRPSWFGTPFYLQTSEIGGYADINGLKLSISPNSFIVLGTFHDGTNLSYMGLVKYGYGLYDQQLTEPEYFTDLNKDEIKDIYCSSTNVFQLYQNAPNPFKEQTAISFSLSIPANVTLSVFDIQGRLIKTVLNEELEAGNQSFLWDRTDNYGNIVKSGMYLYKLELPGSYSESKQMIVID